MSTNELVEPQVFEYVVTERIEKRNDLGIVINIDKEIIMKGTVTAPDTDAVNIIAIIEAIKKKPDAVAKNMRVEIRPFR